MRRRQHPSAVGALSAGLVIATVLWIASGCRPHSPAPPVPPVQQQTDSLSARSVVPKTDETSGDTTTDAGDSASSACPEEPEPGRPFEPERLVNGVKGELTSFRYHSGLLAWIEDRRVLAMAEPFGTRKVLSSPNSGVDSISLNGTHLFWVGGRPWMDEPATRVRDADAGHWSLNRATGKVRAAPGQGVCLVADDDFLYTTLQYPEHSGLGDLVRFSLSDMEKIVLLRDVPLNVYCQVSQYVYLDRPQGRQSVPKDGSPASAELKEGKHFECTQVDGRWFFEVSSVSFTPLMVPVEECFKIESAARAPEADFFLVGDFQPRGLAPGSVSTPPAPDRILKFSRLCAAPPIVIARLRKPNRGRIVYGDGYVYWGDDGAIYRTPE